MTQSPSIRPRAHRWMALAAAVLATTSAHAGTIRDDRSDSLYTALANDPRYSSVGKVYVYKTNPYQFASGVLISSQWVLTAGHVTYDPGDTTTAMLFQFGSATPVVASQWLTEPNYTGSVPSSYDIGLIHLATPIDISPGSGVVPAARYVGNGEVGAVATSVGYGPDGHRPERQHRGDGGHEARREQRHRRPGQHLGHPASDCQHAHDRLR